MFPVSVDVEMGRWSAILIQWFWKSIQYQYHNSLDYQFFLTPQSSSHWGGGDKLNKHKRSRKMRNEASLWILLSLSSSLSTLIWVDVQQCSVTSQTAERIFLVRVFQEEDRGHLFTATGILSQAEFIDSRSVLTYGCMYDYAILCYCLCVRFTMLCGESLRP